MSEVRLDKWLWAARFFKTRSQAREAIEGGKVHCEGQRAKPSKTVRVGAHLSIRQGWDEKAVTVTGLSEQRRSATEAAALYQETPESLQKREQAALLRKLAYTPAPQTRPTKKQRRELQKIKFYS